MARRGKFDWSGEQEDRTEGQRPVPYRPPRRDKSDEGDWVFLVLLLGVVIVAAILS